MLHDQAVNFLLTWHGAVMDTVTAERRDLTMRQMAVMLNVYLTDGPHTVRGLAVRLGVGKPVITRALDTLGGMGLLRRKRDSDDRRNVLVQRTVKGAVYMSELAEVIAATQHKGADSPLEIVRAA